MAAFADLVLAVGPALDVALKQQRDQVVASRVCAAIRDLSVEERIQRVGRGEDLRLRGAVDATVDERVGPGPERLVALDPAALAAATRRPLARFVAWLWAPTIALAVVATGNHYVLDAVAGAALGRTVRWLA